MTTDRVWIGNGAGPLILIPQALLPEWSGIDVPPYRVVNAVFRWSDKETRASDYDRACDIDDYAAVIPVGHGEGLVLGDMPHLTTWIPQDFGGLFARWEYADNDEAMEAALATIPASLTWQSIDTFIAVSSPLEFFNSGEPGMEQLSERLEIDLIPGRYDVSWSRFASNDSTAAILIALRRAAA